MSLVPSLLQAIVGVDGEALVMHAGDKPYVVAPSGQIELASRGLTLEAVNGIVSQLLPADALSTLEEFGAIQHELAAQSEFPGESFTVVAARGGDDVWVEIRRRKIADDDRVPDEFFAPSAAPVNDAVHVAHLAPADAVAAPVAAAQQHVRDQQSPIGSDYLSDIHDVAPLGHAGRYEEVSRQDLEEQGDVIRIDLDDLAIPDEETFFERPETIEVDAASSAAAATRAHDIPPPSVVLESAPWVTSGAAVVTPPPSAPPALMVSAAVVPPTVVSEPVAPPVKVSPPSGPPPVVPPPVVSEPVAPPAMVSPPHEPPSVVLPSVVPEAVAPVMVSPPFVPPPVVPPQVASPPVAPPPVVVSKPVAAPAIMSPPVVPPPVVSPPVLLPPVVVSEPVAPPAMVSPPIASSQIAPPAVPQPPIMSKPSAPPAMASPPIQPRPIEVTMSNPVAPVEAPPPIVPPPVVPPPVAPSSVVSPPVVPLPVGPEPVSPHTPAPESEPASRAPWAQPAVVLPMSRSPILSDAPALATQVGVPGLDRLLRMAAARGASTLYLSSDARPSVRVDGEIQMLEGEPSHGPNDVESLLLTLMPERNHEALRSGVATEWISDVDGVGRVRCLSFRDHRGPGGVFRMMPVRAVSSEQLGLSGEVQALALEPAGLVLIAGSRLSGKRTMISALVDLINHTRRDHVITIENEINVVHERGTSFISQREVRGSYDDVERVVRVVLREDPDVLVIESMRTAPLINVGLEAAASGQLVIGGFPAHNTTAAVDRIINLYPPENRRQVQLALAENLRGIVAQVLLRKTGGGRLAAREVLLNTPAVASIIAEGRTSQLPLAIEGGRRQGMSELNDALLGFVQSGAVDVREAYRRAADRAGFLVLARRLGMDTTLIERLA